MYVGDFDVGGAVFGHVKIDFGVTSPMCMP